MHKKISSTDVPAKYLEWGDWQAVPLRLFGPLIGPILVVNQRAYFNSNDFTKSKNGKIGRIVGIQIKPGTIIDEVPRMFYQGMQVLPFNALQNYTLTLMNDKGVETHKDIPLTDLIDNQNHGKIRIFDLFPKIDECYVVLTNTGFSLGTTNVCILFNFLTVPW